MNDTTIQSKWIYTDNGKLIEDGQIVVENGKIVYLGPEKSSEVPQGSEIRKYPKGMIVPPFINSHTHLPETLIRGIVDDVDFHEWLYDHVWKVEPKMKAGDAKIGALLGIAEMVASGTIGFIDQYFYSDEIAEAVFETGIKAFLFPSIFDGNPETGNINDAFKRNIVILQKWHKKDNRILVGFGPHAPYSLTTEEYEMIYESAEKHNTLIHTHLNETKREVKESIDKHGLSPIELMDKIGVLDRIIAAHCTNVSENDMQLLLSHKTSVLHCIQSNLKIAVGIGPIPEMVKRGINVCLGTDGSASNNNLDMLEELRLTALIHKGVHYDPRLMDKNTVIQMGTKNASKVFGQNVYSGELGVGNNADLVVIDLDHVNTTPVIDPISNWIYASDARNVKLTMSNGNIVYDNGNFPTMDISSIVENAQKSIDRMIQESNYK